MADLNKPDFAPHAERMYAQFATEVSKHLPTKLTLLHRIGVNMKALPGQTGKKRKG